MRQLEISVPADQRETAVEELEDRGIGYTVVETAETGQSGEEGAGDHDGDARYLVQFSIPADAVEELVEELEEAGIDTGTYTVSIDTEFSRYPGVDDVQDRWGASPNRIAPATLRSKAKDLRLNTRSYVWMMVLSAIVATAGLLLSSPAIVVGSMVIAPIVNPMLTASVGFVRNDRSMVLGSVHSQALGLAVAVGVAAVVALAVQWIGAVPARLAIDRLDLIALRTAPGVLAFVVGLAAGAAGAFGLATKGQTSILGVMIAAALIPTAAAAGIGIAWWNVSVAVGAALLLLLNVVAINVGATATLAYLDYRPDDVGESVLAFDRASRVVVVAATVLAVAAVVAVVGVGFEDQRSFDRDVNEVATDVLDREAYDGLEVQNVDVEYDGPASGGDDATVTVTVSRTAGQEFTDLPDVLDREITDRTGREVVVQVEYVDYHRSDAPETAASAPDVVDETRAAGDTAVTGDTGAADETGTIGEPGAATGIG